MRVRDCVFIFGETAFSRIADDPAEEKTCRDNRLHQDYLRVRVIDATMRDDARLQRSNERALVLSRTAMEFRRSRKRKRRVQVRAESAPALIGRFIVFARFFNDLDFPTCPARREQLCQQKRYRAPGIFFGKFHLPSDRRAPGFFLLTKLLLTKKRSHAIYRSSTHTHTHTRNLMHLSSRRIESLLITSYFELPV